MTEEERKDEGAEEEIEDLEAPAAKPKDPKPKCPPHTKPCGGMVTTVHTCADPTINCGGATCKITEVFYE
jgi:hypothetical protein